MAEKEYIEKGSLLKHFDDVINNKFGDADFKKAAWGFSIYVDKMPAADVAPVVRCKDCKYLMFSDCYGECSRGYLGIVRPDCYCCYGEKKER